jgi:hypothetical protein
MFHFLEKGRFFDVVNLEEWNEEEQGCPSQRQIKPKHPLRNNQYSLLPISFREEKNKRMLTLQLLDCTMRPPRKGPIAVPTVKVPMMIAINLLLSRSGTTSQTISSTSLGNGEVSHCLISIVL